jgi:hypothetical protein
MSEAHNEIVGERSVDTLFLAGTTTLLGGLLLELAGLLFDFVTKPQQLLIKMENMYLYVPVLETVKLFIIATRQVKISWYLKEPLGTVKDITCGNRQNIDDVRDPGLISFKNVNSLKEVELGLNLRKESLI